jgi:hypothetical protein
MFGVFEEAKVKNNKYKWQVFQKIREGKRRKGAYKFMIKGDKITAIA